MYDCAVDPANSAQNGQQLAISNWQIAGQSFTHIPNEFETHWTDPGQG